MPAIKELVEVENKLTPEPVTKEIPKCDIDKSKEGDGKNDAVSKDDDVVASTEAVPAIETPAEVDSKAQDTEITSSAETKEPSSSETKESAAPETKESSVSDVKEPPVTDVKEPPVSEIKEPSSSDGVNGSTHDEAKSSESVKTDGDDSKRSADSSANGNKSSDATEVESASDKSAEAEAEAKGSSKALTAVAAEKETSSEVSTSDVVATPTANTEDGSKKDDALSSSATEEKAGKVTDEGADKVVLKEDTSSTKAPESTESKTNEPETTTPLEKMEIPSGDEKKDLVSPSVDESQKDKNSDEKGPDSEASARVDSLTTENEAMETSENTTSTSEANPIPKSSSDTIKKDEAAQDGTSQDDTKKDEKPSADSTSEEKSTDASSEAKSETNTGSSSTSNPQTDDQKSHELKMQGLAFVIQKNFFAAADTFGKLLEHQAPIYGEMSEKLAETYFLYGSAMYEYGKTENTVLGEDVPKKDEDEEHDDDEEEEETEEKMEVEDAPEVNGKEGESGEEVESAKKDAGSSSDDKPADESLAETAEEDKEDDDSFRVAWEMLELAKTTFEKANNKKRLADTFMKLGELGIETGNSEAISEMVKGLQVRKEIFPENHRIIPETHFNIGVAYAFFEKYDEAVEHFTEAKKCLENRIESLSKSDAKEDVEEVEEMKKIVPEINEKIQDTKESKADKEKLKTQQESGDSSKPESTPFPAASNTSTPVTNITHLVKRKRNVDDILPERAAKQCRQEDGKADSEASSTTSESKPTPIDESKPSSKEAKVEETKPVVDEHKSVTDEPKPVVEESKPLEESKPSAPEETKTKMEEEPKPAATEEGDKQKEGETDVKAISDEPTPSTDKTEDTTKPNEKVEEEKMEVS